MTGFSNTEERIRIEFSTARKEYAAFDRTLDALSALSFILKHVREIAEETSLIDFRAKIEAVDPDTEPYTPDGLIIQKHSDFVLELKTSWNDKDVRQVIKYAKSAAYLSRDGKRQSFRPNKCILLGYQNPPGEGKLDTLFDSWKSHGFHFPLVVFRYSLEQAPEGDRIYVARVAYGPNGLCPASSLGCAMNSPRGVSISADKYKRYRPKFHKANDQVIASYAAVLWWTKYAKHYLSEEQRSEMAEGGRLSSPLVLKFDQIGDVPALTDVEVPLGPKDVRHALEFLMQAKLVSFKKRAGAFEIELKEDRYIRVPHGGPVTTPPLDISAKILARWTIHKVRRPIELADKRRRKGAGRRRAGTDARQRELF